MISRSHVGEHRKHDTALRHKIRNLRAKVRLLLPLELCCKDQKRAKNLVKMAQHRQAQHALLTHLWNHPIRPSQQLYVPSHPEHVHKHLFDKLSQSEIQQIKEDKLYYVGEEFLEEFDEFLKAKEQGKFKLHSDQKRPLIMMDSAPNLFHHTSQSVRDDFEPDHTNKEEKKMRNILKMEEIRSKRRQIQNHDLTKRAYMKLKSREKQEKHYKNYLKLQQEKIEHLRQRGQTAKLKTAESFRRRHNYEQLGEIYHLTQKLRKVCLERNSSSKFLLRS